MINYCHKKWHQNYSKLKSYIQNNVDAVQDFTYEDFVQMCVDCILNGKESRSRRSASSGGIEWDSQGIKQLCNNGGNCSLNFYLIPRNTFGNPPTESDCLLTFAFKDSSRDSLKSLQKNYSRANSPDSDKSIAAALNICYELVERMVCPYNAGLI